MNDNILKLAKIGADSSIDTLIAIFNFNMDQLMVFGGGAPGEQGDQGDSGPQGDQGYSVYGDGSNTGVQEEIIESVRQEEGQIIDNGSDFFINRLGIWKVSRNDTRTVSPLFFWKQETAEDFGSNNFIFEKAQEQEVAPQYEETWDNSTFPGKLTPIKHYNSSIVLIGDYSKWANFEDKRCPTSSPINFLNDGIISFVNTDGKNNNPEKYVYTISASYNESGNDMGRSGLYLGMTENTTIQGLSDVKRDMIHIFMDYIYKDGTFTNFVYTNGAIISKGSANVDNTNNTLSIVKYKDKWDNEAKTVILEDVVYYKKSNNIFDTSVSLTVLSNSNNKVTCKLEGVINAEEIGIGKYIDFSLNPKGFILNSNLISVDLIHGHVVNSYGPEHIEFYGASAFDIGFSSIKAIFSNVDKKLSINFIPRSTTGLSIISEYNNKGIYIDIMFSISLNNLQ